MKSLPQYKVSIEEIHHTQKLDAPSGTAITLANEIIKNSEYNSWTLDKPKSKKLVSLPNVLKMFLVHMK